MNISGTILRKRSLNMQKNMVKPTIDVGCNDNPLENADLLCDIAPKKYKAFLRCDAQHLPLRDKTFKFLHCSHALEHVDNPKKMLAELQRVAEKGYIECPTWLQETFFYGLERHKWIISKKGKRLFCRRIRKRKILPQSDIEKRPKVWIFIYTLLNIVYSFFDENFHLFRMRYYF